MLHLAFLITCYDSFTEVGGHDAEHFSLRGSKLNQRGSEVAVMWVCLCSFGVGNQTSAYTLCTRVCSCCQHLLMETYLQDIALFMQHHLHIQTSDIATCRNVLRKVYIEAQAKFSLQNLFFAPWGGAGVSLQSCKILIFEVNLIEAAWCYQNIRKKYYFVRLG